MIIDEKMYKDDNKYTSDDNKDEGYQCDLPPSENWSTYR